MAICVLVEEVAPAALPAAPLFTLPELPEFVFEPELELLELPELLEPEFPELEPVVSTTGEYLIASFSA